MKTIEGIKLFYKDILYGANVGLKWTIGNIKSEEKIYLKLIYIIAFMLDIILVPVKMIFVPVLMFTNKKFKNFIFDLFDEAEEEVIRRGDL